MSTSGGRERSSGGEPARASAGLRAPERAAALADEGAERIRAGARRRGARAEADADDTREGGRVVADEVDVARSVRPLLLRDGDDRDRRLAVRRRAVRDGGVPRLAA